MRQTRLQGFKKRGRQGSLGTMERSGRPEGTQLSFGWRNEMAVGTSPRRAPLAAHGGAEAEDEGIQDRGSMLDFETEFKM